MHAFYSIYGKGGRTMQPIIDAKDLVHEYSRRDEEGNVTGITRALDGVSMQVKQGDLIAVLGANGSGKSTFAKHLNALLTPTEGTLYVGGMECGDHTKDLDIRKTVGMVFQNPDNQIIANVVEEDVGFGPENIGVPTEEIWERVADALKTVGMYEYRLNSPNKLSGGQKQRVAIARALINKPRVLLLDEPLGALDLKLRKQMQLELKRLQRKLNITFIYVTHDQEEALTMSDRIAIMHDGILDQLGTPSEIYEAPKTKFVATFIGETNIFDGTVGFINGDEVQVTVENGFITGKGDDFKFGEYITVSVRPEKMKYSETPVEGFGIKAVVKDYIYVGSVIKCIVVLPNGNELKIERLAGESLPEIGSAIYPYWNKEDAVLIHSRENSIFEALDNVVLA